MRVLRRIVCCVFGGFLEVIAKHADHGDTLLNGYPGTRAPGAKNPADFGSDPDPVEGSTRPGKPAGYPGSKRTGGTPSVLVYCCLLMLFAIVYLPPEVVLHKTQAAVVLMM